MSAWDEAAAAATTTQPENFFEDASEHFRALQELVGEWQEVTSISPLDAADVDDESKAHSMQRITMATNAHATQVLRFKYGAFFVI